MGCEQCDPWRACVCIAAAGNVTRRPPSIYQQCKLHMRRYERTHLFNATRFFQRTVDRHGRQRFVRGLTPLGALPLAAVQLLDISYVDAGGSDWHFFNPSLCPAPSSLRRRCPTCSYVVAMHASPLHQCDQTSPLLRPAHRQVGSDGAPLGKHTAVAVLDGELHVLGWTWLLNEPSAQVASRPDGRGHVVGLEKWARFLSSPRNGRVTDTSRVNNSGWFVPLGTSGSGFSPPRLQQVFDVRLVNANGRIFASASCKGCTMLLYSVHVDASPSADGRSLHGLRAWAVQSFTTSHTRHPWAQGRNQVHFADTRPRPSGHEEAAGQPAGQPAGLPAGLPAGERTVPLVTQVWLNVFGSWGAPPVARSRTVVCHATNETPRFLRRLRAIHANGSSGVVAAGARLCGATPKGEHIDVEIMDEWATSTDRQHQHGHQERWRRERAAGYAEPPGAFGKATLLANHTLPADLLSVPGYSWTGPGKQLSLTANPLLIRAPNGCAAFLGVGHVHRGDGPLNRWFHRDRRRRPSLQPSTRAGRARGRLPPAPRRRLRWTQPLQFGFRYSHFFYTFAPEPPYRLLATSAEFCVQAASAPAGAGNGAQNAPGGAWDGDCEEIQFLSGLALDEGGTRESSGDNQTTTLLISYGVNDCEARIGRLRLERLWPMMRPLPGEERACV